MHLPGHWSQGDFLHMVALLQSCGVILLIIRDKHCIQCLPCSSQIISEMLPEIHTVQKCYCLIPTIHSQII